MLKTYTVGTGAVVRLRPVQLDDEEFLCKVYASTRAEEMKLVPWDEAQKEAFVRMQFAAQQQHYGGFFPEAEHLLIALDDQPVGRIYINRDEQEIRILDVTILPEQRGAGVGTPLVKGIMAEAAETNRCVSIYVESHSPALRLFERLGFSMVENDDVNALMRWCPAV
jgi:RimJ/RimL family protein N-acetyltransferase